MEVKTGSEKDVLDTLQNVLDVIAPEKFGCRERKQEGESAIGKPVDLEIYFLSKPNVVAVAVEVANVNTTQLVGEACRLYYDTCFLKLLILGDRNVPLNGKEQCEKLLAKLYGQESILYTPARVEWYNDREGIMKSLKELLLIF